MQVSSPVPTLISFPLDTYPGVDGGLDHKTNDSVFLLFEDLSYCFFIVAMLIYFHQQCVGVLSQAPSY